MSESGAIAKVNLILESLLRTFRRNLTMPNALDLAWYLSTVVEGSIAVCAAGMEPVQGFDMGNVGLIKNVDRNGDQTDGRCVFFAEPRPNPSMSTFSVPSPKLDLRF